MADIRAFRAFRYDMGRVGSLSDVVAPPYDVIDPPLQGRLFAASPYNAVRLELPQGGPGDTESENKYTRAARTLKEWVSESVLRQDTARAVAVAVSTTATASSVVRITSPSWWEGGEGSPGCVPGIVMMCGGRRRSKRKTG